jgi:hypothetical protein
MLGCAQETIQDLYQCKRLLCIRFGAEQVRNKMKKYDGKGTPTKHFDKCITQWRMTPPEEWPHRFIHTLEGILEN